MVAIARNSIVKRVLEREYQTPVSQDPKHPGESLQELLDTLRKDDWQSQQAVQFDEAIYPQVVMRA